MIRMPARQRRTIFDNISRRSENSPLVEASWHVVIRTKHIEVASLEPLDHEIDGLLPGPGAGRFFSAALSGQAGKHEAGNQEMRRDAAAFEVSQLVFECFGKSLHAGFRDVVSGIAG